MNNPYWDYVNEIAEKQRNKGIKDYGQGIEMNTANVHKRIEMALEELVDLSMYLCWIEDELKEKDSFKKAIKSPEEIDVGLNDVLKKEYSEQFDNERKRRMEISYYKYGPARDNYASGRVDALATAYLCLDAFKKDHNLEHLIDAANYLMLRFKYPMPGDHFTPTDSSGSVGTVGTPINLEKEN